MSVNDASKYDEGEGEGYSHRVSLLVLSGVTFSSFFSTDGSGTSRLLMGVYLLLFVGWALREAHLDRGLFGRTS